MPLKLRAVLGAACIAHAQFGKTIRQSDGKPLSESTVSLWLGKSLWPKRTPRSWLEQQTRNYLRSLGVPEADAPDLFESDESKKADHASTVSDIFVAHPSERKRRRVTVAAPDEVPDYQLEPVMLTPAARRHFKLFRDPFNADPECAEDVFRGPDQQFVSESIWEAVRNSRLFALVGESGSGKSTLMDDFKDRIRREALPVRLIQPMLPEKKKLSGTGILEAIVRDLAPETTLRARSEGLTRQAHNLLADSAEAGLHNVVVFEEAHDLSIHALKQLKRFHEFKTGWKRLLSIVLIAQPELLSSLGDQSTCEAREVARRLEILHLLPLDSELEGYVAHKLARANAAVDTVFAPDTFDAVRARLRSRIKDGPRAGEGISMAYPLLVNNLLVKAMNTAAELGAGKVDAGIVKGC